MLFDDEMALDNAQLHILSNMCRYMQLNTFGTETMLRSRLYAKIRDIRKEDQVKILNRILWKFRDSIVKVTVLIFRK